MAEDSLVPASFKVEFPEEHVARMCRLISDTRLPEGTFAPQAGWDYGVDLAWLKDMRDSWLNEYDWKEVQRQMNELKHFTVHIESVSLHFVHHRSERPDAVPILLTHGWPGEFD